MYEAIVLALCPAKVLKLAAVSESFIIKQHKLLPPERFGSKPLNKIRKESNGFVYDASRTVEETPK